MTTFKCKLCIHSPVDIECEDMPFICEHKEGSASTLLATHCRNGVKGEKKYVNKCEIGYYRYLNDNIKKKNKCIICEHRVNYNNTAYCYITKMEISMSGGCNYENGS